jgi:hydrogenase maturation protease
VAERVVIGIGNPDRGDDAVGHEVVRLLRGRVPADVVLATETGEATALLRRLDGAGSVFLVDAARSGGAPGAVRRFDARARSLPSGLGAMSSHGFGLAQAIELARALGCLPRTCVVYAVEGAGFDAGASLTPEVARAASEVAGRLLVELSQRVGVDA